MLLSVFPAEIIRLCYLPLEILFRPFIMYNLKMQGKEDEYWTFCCGIQRNLSCMGIYMFHFLS